MFSIKIVFPYISLSVFQIKPVDICNSKKYVSVHIQYLFLLSMVLPIDLFPQKIEIQFLALDLE